jgi:hypothetical protein
MKMVMSGSMCRARIDAAKCDVNVNMEPQGDVERNANAVVSRPFAATT